MNDALLGALLVIAVGIVFWCLSVVCEERFVPALAVICDVLKIPDDVAGATLMAAGACSPEVVSSFIALFVTHSALGVGSVVGSEIFNHLCICAGSVFYAKGGVLVLDKAIVARETLFYAIALVLLLYVLMREHDAQNHIVIRWWAGPVLVAVYALYVVVAATSVARRGLGNMAVSNALGSNTFNVLIGLGLPWLAFCLSHGGVYHGLPAEDIVVPVLVLVVTLLLFLVLLLCTGFRLYRVHAAAFLGAYVAFLVWAVGKEYLGAANDADPGPGLAPKYVA